MSEIKKIPCIIQPFYLGSIMVETIVKIIFSLMQIECSKITKNKYFARGKGLFLRKNSELINVFWEGPFQNFSKRELLEA